MSKYRSTLRPSWLDEAFLKRAVAEQFPRDQAGFAAQEKEIDFGDIDSLCLHFKDILQIHGLQKFTSLTTLVLCNNLIEKIEGLDNLVALTWLDLSSNRLQKIEGLESLQKLEVLMLTNNMISVIENMDSLEKLSNFYIANNNLGQLDNVLYLKKFNNLYALNLSGNPLSTNGDYKLFIVAHLPKLTCLDYEVIDEAMKKEAAAKYHRVLEDMSHDDQQPQQTDETEQNHEDVVQLHKDAFVELLNGPYLFKSMFEDDDEDTKILQLLPEVTDLIQIFEKQMVELCKQLFEIGLAEHEKRQAEVSSFFSGQKNVTHFQERASKILAKFEEQHRQRLLELQQLSDVDLREAKISHCNHEINHLCESFFSLEFQLVSQMEEIIKQFEINISEMVDNFTGTVQGILAQCRALEENYHGKVHEIAVATLESVAEDELMEDLPEDVQTLFKDKNAVMNALAAGHDNHMLKINNRETQMIQSVEAWKASLIKGIQDKELQQNCEHLSDIQAYANYLRKELEDKKKERATL